jgi:hypothetical protein
MWCRRASGWSIRRIKLTMKNHISLSVNLYWIKIWSDLEIKGGNWSYSVKYSKSQPLRVNSKAKSNVATLIKSKRNGVTIINIVQAQVEELYFIFNLECRHAALSRGILHRLPIKSQCSTYPKNSSGMSETQWPYTLHLSLNPEKTVCSSFQIPDVLFDM